MKIRKLIYFFLFLAITSCTNKGTIFSRKINFHAAYVVNGGSNSISVIDLNTLTVQRTIPLNENGKYPHHISLSPDRKKIAIATPEFDFTQSHDSLHKVTNKKGGIVIINARTGKTERTLPLPKANFNAAFSNDNTEIWSAVVTHSGEMYVFDANSGAQKSIISLGSDPTEVVFSKNGNYAFVALEESSFLLTVDAKLKQVKKFIKVDPFPTNVWSGNNGNIYVENKHLKTISVIDEKTLEVNEFVDLKFKPGQIAYNKSLNELWICQAGEDKVACFERNNNAWVLKSTITTGQDTHAIAFSADDKIAYVVNQKENTVSVIDAGKHQKMKDISVGQLPNGIVLRE